MHCELPREDHIPTIGLRGAVQSLTIAINVALLGVFGLQHSIMARPAFKRVWTKLVPQPIERATYCLASSACLILLYWAWRPMPGIVWDFTGAPEKLIAEAARDNSADLIAMTTHGRGGLSRALLGSTAEKLVRIAKVPTLTIRPK